MRFRLEGPSSYHFFSPLAGTATFKQFNMCLFDITMVQIFQIHEVPIDKKCAVLF